MEKSNKRGKIPQDDWPSIISRYESGETLASIARTYDCSPPAISYIVSRTRLRGKAGEETAPKASASVAGEPQLVKAGSAAITNDIADGELMHNNDPPEQSKQTANPATDVSDVANPSDEPPHTDPPSPSVTPPHGMPKDDASVQRAGKAAGDTRAADDAMRSGNPGLRAGAGDGGSHSVGEGRRTLHLPLPQGNGAAHGAAAHPAAQNRLDLGHATDGRPISGQAISGQAISEQAISGQAISGQAISGQAGLGQSAQPELALQPRQSPAQAPAPIRGSVMPEDQPNRSRDSGAFIDRALRERISDDIAAFLAAFDAALDHDTIESRSGLREATDRLLRAGARTRIELERLEARLPLSARDGGQRPFPAPRPR